MKKISGSTFYFKKFFPTIWFGFLGLFFFTAISSGALKKSFIVLLIPIIMATFGYFLFKKLVWDLADEVFDNGDSLLFRKGNKEQIVKFRDIINISHSQFTSPERIVIHTRNEGQIGKELVFSPPMRFFSIKKSPLVNELIERVDKARNT